MFIPKHASARLWITGSYAAAKALWQAVGLAGRGADYFNCRDGSMIIWCGGPLLVPGIGDEKACPLDDSAQRRLGLLRMLASQATEIIHAGDPAGADDAVIGAVLDWLSCGLPVKRFRTDAFDEKTLKARVRDAKDFLPIRRFFGAMEAGKGRAWADRKALAAIAEAEGMADHDGESFSEGARLWLPVLVMIARRDYAVRHAEPRSAFSIEAELEAESKADCRPVRFRAVWAPTAESSGTGMADQSALTALVSRLASEKTAIVRTVENKTVKTPPPACLTLVELQMLAARLWGISPADTLVFCRWLCEKHRILSAPCTECGTLPEAVHGEAPQVLAAIAETCPVLASTVKRADPGIKSPAFCTMPEGALHGLVPLAQAEFPADLIENEARIYQLAAKRFIMQFFPDYETEETAVCLDIGGKPFEARSRRESVRGWRVLYTSAEARTAAQRPERPVIAGRSSAASARNAKLPALEPGTAVLVRAVHVIEVRTKPPEYFTEGTLIAAMERIWRSYDDPDRQNRHQNAGGIGKPWERGAVIEALKRRGWVEADGPYLHCTPEGRSLLLKVPPELRSAAAATALEAKLGQIEAGLLRLDALDALLRGKH